MAKLDSRRSAFWLLCIYVASGLGLLVTTSFLGLRRYLRQRRLEMPLEMAGVWLSLGAAMIVALLVVCTLLPRPNAEYSVTHLSFQIGSSDRLAPSRNAPGHDGAPAKDRPTPPSATGTSPDSPGKTPAAQPPKPSDAPSPDSASPGSSPGSGKPGRRQHQDAKRRTEDNTTDARQTR